KIYKNDKNLSEIQLEHEKEYGFVAVVVKVVHEYDDFGVDVLRFQTRLTDILGFLEKLKWWFEQDIDDEGEEYEEGEDSSEVWDLYDLNIGKDRIKWQSMDWIE
nr:hypothetical protein [Tanacetum cinerariifolium]